MADLYPGIGDTPFGLIITVLKILVIVFIIASFKLLYDFINKSPEENDTQ